MVNLGQGVRHGDRHDHLGVMDFDKVLREARALNYALTVGVSSGAFLNVREMLGMLATRPLSWVIVIWLESISIWDPWMGLSMRSMRERARRDAWPPLHLTRHGLLPMWQVNPPCVYLWRVDASHDVVESRSWPHGARSFHPWLVLSIHVTPDLVDLLARSHHRYL